METLTTIFYFIITIGILVFVHEFGHFIAAKLCGMRVDRFSIGFPPRAFGKKFGETDYCISWIPIGGYVKIAGMIDESFDTGFINQEPRPYEFRSKPVWQRMFVISAGVLMNLILAVVIFWMINYFQGESLRQTTEIGYVAAGSAAEKAGFTKDDKIVSANGQPIEHWDAIQNALYIDNMGENISFTVLRGGQNVTLQVPASSVPDIAESSFGILPKFTEPVITEVLKGRPAEQSGLLPGDIITSLNNEAVVNDMQVRTIIHANPTAAIPIVWKRGDSAITSVVTPSKEGLIGIGIQSRYTGPVLRIQYGIFESLPKGIQSVGGATSLFAQSIWQIIVGKVSFTKSVGGPVKIAQFASRSAEVGILSYLAFVALLSISLAVLNILPFPALDGGHLIILLYEAVFRKPLPTKVQQAVQQAGVMLLLAFMAFVLYNDIFGM